MSYEECQRTYKALKEYLKSKNLLSDTDHLLPNKSYCKKGTYKYKEGYNRQYHSGIIIDELNNLTANEIAMIMDDGPAYFSSSKKTSDGHFEITIVLD